MTKLQRKDYYLLFALYLVTLLVFFPILAARYLYSDEVVQLWNYRSGSQFFMFADQGRLVTEYLFKWLFGAIHTIDQVTYIRLFSFAGWLVCLPVWYTILKRLVANEASYAWLPFFTCLYLVTSLPFGISVQWASCLELFLANTAALVSGYLIYTAVSFTGNKPHIKIVPAIAGVGVGVISLFTYQTATGCFLIPFLLHFIGRHTTNKDRMIITGVVAYFIVYVVYFPLFKLSIALLHLGHNNRTNIYIDPLKKLEFFFSHPLERSFWFNAIISETSKIGRALYKVLLAGWLVVTFIRFGKQYGQAIKHILVVLAVYLLSYLPLLIVKEAFASNRTMLALDLCVFIVCLETLLYFIKKPLLLKAGGVAIAVALIAVGFYNLRYQFLKPVTNEYVAIKQFIQQRYNAGVKTIYIIKSTGDAFENKYNIHLNMDEYGMPTSAFDWTMEPLSRQVVYELTGNRQTGEQLIIAQWDSMENFSNAGKPVDSSVLLLNVPAILEAYQPAGR